MASEPQSEHVYRINNREVVLETPPADLNDLAAKRHEIEPWVTSLVASEHLSLLLGSGLTTALMNIIETPAVDMSPVEFQLEHHSEVDKRADILAASAGRGTPNIEDQLRAALDLIAGLRVMEMPEAEQWETALSTTLKEFALQILGAESSLLDAISGPGDGLEAAGLKASDMLASFLSSFVGRAATKERLHIFTTNYDRVVEFGLDQAGIWKIDRFIGSVTPRFRSSRLDVDLHYSPPGIRGEPRYLEGVVRLTKLHGSIDWVAEGLNVSRLLIPFGCKSETFEDLVGDRESLLIYPNPAKDIETSQFPYAELFRDFSAAIVRPESVLVTYGYGFGDDHINRVIQDMLTIPSTHLLVMSHGDPDLRFRKFLERVGRMSQISFLLGPHFSDLESLVHWYLPKPSVDRITIREASLLQRRGMLPQQQPPETDEDESSEPSVGEINVE